MRTEDAGKVIARVGACWPRPPMDAAHIGVWVEHLEKRELDVALAACRMLERTEKHRPSVAEFLEAYDAARHSTPNRLLGKPDCGICEDGWVDMPCECGSGSPMHCVKPCPNGCVPMGGEERRARGDRADRDFAEARRQRNMDRRVDVPLTTSSQDRREREEPF